MPYKALVDGSRVNSLTLPDRDWLTIHVPARVRSAEIHCLICGARMYPQVRVYPPPIGELRCFGHWPGEGDRQCLGESIGHLALKAEVARASERAGWTTDVEVSFPGGRCDVVATRNGTAHAFEAQLSPLAVDAAVDRNQRYVSNFGQVTWLHPGRVPWRRQVPALQLGEVDDDQAGFTIVGGVSALADDEDPLPPHPLILAVPRLLEGRYVYVWEARADESAWGTYWDRFAGVSEDTARRRVRRRAGVRSTPVSGPSDRIRRDVCNRTDTDLSELTEQIWRLRPNLPNLLQFDEAPPAEPYALGHPPAFVAGDRRFEADERRMYDAVVARRRERR
jgi:hypothetical protein